MNELPNEETCKPFRGKRVRVKYTTGGIVGHWTGPFILADIDATGIWLDYADAVERRKKLAFGPSFQGIEEMPATPHPTRPTSESRPDSRPRNL
jgi:hypothetical protein